MFKFCANTRLFYFNYIIYSEKISANEKDIDNLFLLKDGTYSIVNYEAEYKKLNKIKYLNYIARVMEKCYKEDENFSLRLIVIYTGYVNNAEPTFETNCITLRTEQAFLSHINEAAAFDTIWQKILSGVIVANDKFINREYLDQIRRRINMTQLGQMCEKEKIKYGIRKQGKKP